MYIYFIIPIVYPVMQMPGTITNKYKYSKFRAAGLGKSPTELPFYKPEQVLYQPLVLFPAQLLPYQYYQIIRGVFLLPSAFSLYNLFLPDYPFAELKYKESQFKQPEFQEKGEYN